MKAKRSLIERLEPDNCGIRISHRDGGPGFMFWILSLLCRSCKKKPWTKPMAAPWFLSCSPLSRRTRAMIHGLNKPPSENRISHNQFLGRARSTPIYLLSIEMSILPRAGVSPFLREPAFSERRLRWKGVRIPRAVSKYL